jgi:hypothetical protein
MDDKMPVLVISAPDLIPHGEVHPAEGSWIEMFQFDECFFRWRGARWIMKRRMRRFGATSVWVLRTG